MSLLSLTDVELNYEKGRRGAQLVERQVMHFKYV